MNETIQSRREDRTARRATLVNQSDRIGLGALLLALLGGLWMMAAPFIVGYQGSTAHWSNGTINEFSVGAGLAALALATIIFTVGGALVELSRTAREVRRSIDESEPAT